MLNLRERSKLEYWMDTETSIPDDAMLSLPPTHREGKREREKTGFAEILLLGGQDKRQSSTAEVSPPV